MRKTYYPSIARVRRQEKLCVSTIVGVRIYFGILYIIVYLV